MISKNRKPLLVLIIISFWGLLSCSRSVSGTIYGLFGVDIRGLDYTIIAEDERWIPINGDGHHFLHLSLDNWALQDKQRLVKQMKENGAHELPITEVQVVIPREELKPFFYPLYDNKEHGGLYLLNIESTDDDYSLLLYDFIKNELFILIERY